MFMTALITSTWIGVTDDFPVEKQTIIHKADVSLYLFQGRPTTYHSWTLTFAQLTTAHLVIYSWFLWQPSPIAEQ